MNPSKPAEAGLFAARIRETVARLALDEPRAADYLGVPVYTLRKWITGERVPSASAIRLLDVLGTVEALAPALHAGFLPSESRHVKKSAPKQSIGSPADSVMSQNPV
jgi:plasmid maintenance system antidote protein VapI